MSYKISQELCETVVATLNLEDSLFTLDVRMGLEQIQDAVGFADYAHERWALTDPTQAPECPEEILNMFRLPTRRTAALTIDQVWTGVQVVIDTSEFRESCQERWEAIGEDYSGHQPQGLVDLGAMPNPDELPA